MTDHEYLNKRWHDICYVARVSYNYHRRRQRYWDLMNKETQALGILLGAGTMTKALEAYVPWFGAAISGIGLLSLVYAYSDRQVQHRDLADEYARFLAEIAQKGQREYSESDLGEWEARQQLINAKEPPTLRTLTVICENEERQALGQEIIVRPNWFKRLLADIFSF
jgi:hypothetical protein